MKTYETALGDESLSPGDVVQHVFTGRYATVTSTKSRLMVTVHLTDRSECWSPLSVRKIHD